EATAKRDALGAAASEAAAKRTAQAKGAETEAVLDFLDRHILAAVGTEPSQGGLGRDVSLRTAIDAALPFVETSFKDQPLTEARLRRTLGNAFLQLGDGRAGAAQYEPARAIYERLLGPDDVNTLAVTNQLGLCYLVPSQGWRSVVVRT